MSTHGDDPLWIRSPWPDEISDEMAELLSCTLHALAMACEDRYSAELRRHYRTEDAELYDPERPWIRTSASQADLEDQARAADFHARQLDLFRPETDWEEDF